MRFLAYFAQDLLEFRMPEINSLCEMFGFKLQHGDLPNPLDPFLEIELPSEEIAVQLAKRCMLIKSIVDVWAEASNYEELFAKLRNADDALRTKTDVLKSPDRTFKFELHGYGTTTPFEERPDALYRPICEAIEPQGRIRLKNPDLTVMLLEDHGFHEIYPEQRIRRVWIGREVAQGPRRMLHEYDLKHRPYIGTTSMKAQLSFLCANMAHARPGTLVLDPFVGTASIILSCAAFGAKVVGSDLDWKTIKGRGPTRNIAANFREKKIPKPDIFILDQTHAPWRPVPFLDAIVCDPPYGIREGSRKTGSKSNDKVRAPRRYDAEDGPIFIPSRVQKGLVDTYNDLLDFAARTLVPNGRLVFWLPTCPQSYTPDEIPTHPCFRLLANSEQQLTTCWSRRLLTMVKIAPYTPKVVEGAPSADDPSFARIRRIVFAKAYRNGAAGTATTSSDTTPTPTGTETETASMEVEGESPTQEDTT
eukprot:gnl/Trimastix_PCT/1862.p1 GENE.gnl/Trimastix_PCT/1862~~gnl/Trimastix_PCT/1862.p1  ORF type:complete len:476 (-),score=111.79 gnl/Trimastix_PCT/1862:2-1429(-)